MQQTMGFNDADAACFASFWCVATALRGPALHLHGRGADVGAWVKGHAVGKGNRFGPWLLLGFVFSVVCVAWPSTVALGLATGCTAMHQLRSLHLGQGHSYMLVTVSNISIAACCMASLARGTTLRVAVTAAAPAVLEAYAILMFFAALGKFNSAFFDPQRSAATVHVIGSLEVRDMCALVDLICERVCVCVCMCVTHSLTAHDERIQTVIIVVVVDGEVMRLEVRPRVLHSYSVRIASR